MKRQKVTTVCVELHFIIPTMNTFILSNLFTVFRLVREINLLTANIYITYQMH